LQRVGPPFYRDVLDYEVGARIVVEFTTRGREVVDYAVVLTVDDEHGEAVTVRVYDGAHGINEMHRHDRAGEKAPAASFHAGTLGEGCGPRSSRFAPATRR
jgi:ferredoxin-NADP reductase